jgi:putative adhesin
MTMQTPWTPSRKAATGILVAMSLCLPAAAFAAEKSFDRTLTVNGPVTLHVSTGSGYIHVSPGSDSQVHIVGHVKGSNSWWGGGSSDDAVAKVADNPPINQAGNIISVGEDHGSDWGRHVSIDYEIKTPSNTMLVAESGSGDLQLSNISGTVRAHTGSGSIHADRLGAGSKLDTGSGTIDAGNLQGSATLQTGSGDLRAQFSSPGDVVAGTGSGSINLGNVQGAVKAETGSGSLEISGQPTSPWKLETGSGDVSLQVGSGARFTLDAQTGSGSVKTDLPLTMRGSLDKHHVTGTVNGGGPTIKAETGSGDIRIQ